MNFECIPGAGRMAARHPLHAVTLKKIGRAAALKKTVAAFGLLPAFALAEAAPTPTLEELDARLRALETAAPPHDHEAATTPAAAGNAFNPATSVILNGTFAHHSLHPDDYARAGFPVVGEGGPLPQGLALGESEISLAANVDDKFYGQLTLALGSEDGDTSLGLEEAFLDSTALPGGLVLRLGRFFSNIGYLNTHHAHTDSFSDRPLAYQALLGNQYGDDGVQLRWVAPTDLFLEISAEVLRGEQFLGSDAPRDGTGTKTLALHAGGDVGSESSWLAGASLLRADALNGEDGFSGRATLYIVDATWKWAPQGNFKDGGITLRSELLLDDRDGDFHDVNGLLPDQTWSGRRRGAYVEGIYRLSRRWDSGYRYDRLWADADGPYASDFDPERHSVMLTWRNSEFSFVRLQLSHETPTADTHDDMLALQYQASFGAHGAHKF